MTERMFLNWSSGKDAALALFSIQHSGLFTVDQLVTTVNTHFDRVSMHGLRRSMLKAQAQAVGLPLYEVLLPENPSMDDYDAKMRMMMQDMVKNGYRHCAFGDILLQDLRDYREELFTKYAINCHFPIWKQDTRELIHQFINEGFKAVTVCVHEKLGEDWLGRNLDASFLSDLPDDIDPCGENGEFHTFCYDGPIFTYPLPFDLGERKFRRYPDPAGKGEIGFWFVDLVDKQQRI